MTEREMAIAQHRAHVVWMRMFGGEGRTVVYVDFLEGQKGRVIKPKMLAAYAKHAGNAKVRIEARKLTGDVGRFNHSATIFPASIWADPGGRNSARHLYEPVRCVNCGFETLGLSERFDEGHVTIRGWCRGKCGRQSDFRSLRKDGGGR